MNIKINIQFPFKKGAYGGSNQFSTSLKEELIATGRYSEKIDDAHVIIFVSHLDIRKIIQLKNKYYNSKTFIHRVDGPINLYTGKNDNRDKISDWANKHIADATIYQSEWSKQKNIEGNFHLNKNNTVIINAANKVFKVGQGCLNKNSKIKIVICSWSINLNKGFDTYKWLDENLDFNKYQVTFIGNSPIKFKNIQHVLPLDKNELANILSLQHVYITASINDTCSNSLIEGLSCGLPALVYNSGGHPEILQKGGFTFNKKEEIPELLDKIILNYTELKKQIPSYIIEDVAEKYYEFAKEAYATKNNKSSISYLNRIGYLYLAIQLKTNNYYNNFLSSF